MSRYKVIPVKVAVEDQAAQLTRVRTRYFVVDTNDPGDLNGISGSDASPELAARMHGYVFAECVTSVLAQLIADDLNP